MKAQNFASQDDYETAVMLMEKGLGDDIELVTLFFENIHIPYGNDKQLNNTIEKAMVEAEIPFESNVSISKKTIVNFLIAGSIAVFCSANASVSEIMKKVESYSKNPHVNSIIVVTNRNISLPVRVYGKDISIIHPE